MNERENKNARILAIMDMRRFLLKVNQATSKNGFASQVNPTPPERVAAQPNRNTIIESAH